MVSPGVYYIREHQGILDAIAMAGGPLSGAKLNEVLIYRETSNANILNLAHSLETGKNINFEIKSKDTIFVKQTVGSYLFSRSSNLMNSILQLLNLILLVSS